jgi:hypothetical protein
VLLASKAVPGICAGYRRSDTRRSIYCFENRYPGLPGEEEKFRTWPVSKCVF